MTKTGNTLDVVAGDATIVVHADDIVVGVIGNANLADNTIALARLVNAGGQSHFLMRKSASAGPWEDGTASDAKTALGIFGNPSALTVRAATTANITLSGTQTVDGVALIAGDRCLVKNQTTGANNGLYCADRETEVLTSSGYKSYDELAVGDIVLTFNLNTQRAQWKPVKAVHVFPERDLEMLSMESPSHSSLTTLNHRWPVLNRHRQLDGLIRERDTSGRFVDDLPSGVRFARIVESANLSGEDYLIRAAVSEAPDRAVHSDALVELVAWFYTEGHIRRNNSGKMSSCARIVQSEIVNADNVVRIQSALVSMIGPPSESLKGAGYLTPQWRRSRSKSGIARFDLNTAAGRLLLAVAPDKIPTFDFIRQLTQDQLKLFVDVSIAADGHTRPTGARQFAQKSEGRLEAFLLACHLSGIPTTVSPRRDDGCYGVNLIQSGGTQPHLAGERVQYRGIVWCPEVENGTWFARRRNTHYFTGNTVASGAWTRTTDAASAGQLFGGLTVNISEGTANGNQVAMLTTDDPITIGSTALTFTMGRVSAVGAVAPLDVTKSAAAIGTSTLSAPLDHKHDISTAAPVAGAVVAGGTATEGTATSVARSDHLHAVAVAAPVDIGTANAAGAAATFVRSDHVHNLPVAVLLAVLATTAAAVSVNSQKITNLATPTVATDAATKGYVDTIVGAPASPGDNGKIAYANAGAIAFRAGVTTSNANQLAFAAEVTNSNLQFEHNTIIARAKDSTGTNYNAFFRWGVATDEFKIGGGGATDMAAMRCTGRASVQYIWEASAGVAIKTLSSQGMTITPVATTGTAASAFKVTDAAHTALALSTERHSVLFDLNQTRQWATGALATQRAFRVIQPTIAFVGASTVTTAATVAIGGGPIAGTNASITQSLALWIEAGSLGFGNSAARSGFVRSPNSNTPILAGRNSTDSADIGAIAVATDNAVYVGDSTNAALVYLQTSGNISFRPTGVGSDAYSFSSTLADFKATAIQFTTASAGSATAASAGLFRTTGSPGTVVGSRNYDNTGNQDVLNVVGDGTTFNDLRVGDDTAKGHNSLYLRSKAQTVVELATVQAYKFFPTYLDFTVTQARFGSTPSTNALINATNNSTILGGKTSGGANSVILSWSSANDITLGDNSSNTNDLYLAPNNTIHVYLAAAEKFRFNATYLDFMSAQARFGASPSTNALLNFSNNSTVAAGKDSGGTDRNLLVWTSGNILQVGSGNITSVQLQSTPGNAWTFGSTASFPGVLHAFAGGATLAFGTASTNAAVNFASANTVLLGAKNISSTDRALLTWGSTDVLTLGASSLTTIVSASGGNWQFGSTAAFPGVGHNIAAGGFLSFGTASASGLLRTANNVTILTAKSASTGDVALVTIDNADELILGDASKAAAIVNKVATGGFWDLEINGTVEYTCDATKFDFTNNRIQFGTTPSTTALVNFAKAQTMLGARNNGNTADISILSMLSTSDTIVLGDSTNAFLEIRAVTYNIKAGATSILQMTSSSIAPAVDIAFASQGNVKSVGYVEYLNMAAPGVPGLLGWRVYCDNVSGDLIAKSSSGVTRTLAIH
jgi:hypothetical protein